MIGMEMLTEAILKNKEWLYKHALVITHNIDEAEEAVGNAIVKAYVNRNKIQKKESIDSWLYKIVHNESYSLMRKRKDMLCITDYENSLCAKDDIEKSVEEQSIWKTVSELPEKYREIVYLFYARELDIKTIHKVTGLPVGTVKSRLNRGREMLRSELTEGGSEDGDN